jgi:iron complex outermembrane recepter protein
MLGRRENHELRSSHARTAAMVALGGALAVSMSGGVLADAPAADEATGPLQEIVVTATRHEEGLSRVPISVTALTQEALDVRGVKDFQDVARFTPGVDIDNSGTNNISIRGIASTGGAGTTGIYLDDTPIQIRALAFNPDEALPKSFDIDRIEVLRGPQGTLFGAGSEGGTVRYITTQPSLTKSSIYSREELSYTENGDPSYEVGVAGGMPIIDGTLGVRATVWYRRDGGYIDHIDPVSLATTQKNANYDNTTLIRLAAAWAPADGWTVTPSYYYQDRYRNNVESYWPLYSDPGNERFVSADPTERSDPDRFYLMSLKVDGDLGWARLISNTSYFHRKEQTGYDGTLYNLGFYQAQPTTPGAFPVIPPADQGGFLPGVFPLLDGTGLHLPPGATNYRSPASVDNGQQNITQELRLQSKDSNAALIWTTGLFFSVDRQSYLEQIHDPLLNELSLAATGQPYTNFFYYTDANGNSIPVTYDPRYPFDSYFLHTDAKDRQYAWFGEATYAFTDELKLTLGARYSKTEFSFATLTGGPQLFLPPQSNSGDKKENSFTPKVSLAYQADPRNLYYFTYAKGFRPGGANNPVPQVACGADFLAFGINDAPATFNSDTVSSFEVGAKNNFNNRVKIASSIYYIRWNNIQQTVVPPICQISFITNLGTAVAKGADIQAEVAFTDAFTTELTAGYTDARYTKDARLSPVETQPIVANGDAIVGQSAQPAAPLTISLGLEYKFTMFDREVFVRADDEYQGRPKWAGAGQDSNTLQFDSANYLLSPTNFASARAGVNFAGWQVAAFVDNLADTHTVTNYNWSIDPGTGDSRLQRQFTYRPRTVGLTFTYRH